MVCISHNSFDTPEHFHHMINFWVEAKYLEISCCCKRYWNFCNTKSRLKAAFRKFYCRYKDIVCPYNLSLSQSCPTCFKTLVKPFIYTDYDYGMLRLPDLDCWFTARVTGQQGMPSSPRHLIPPLVYPEVFFNLFFFFGSRDWLRFIIFACSLIPPKMYPRMAIKLNWHTKNKIFATNFIQKRMWLV